MRPFYIDKRPNGYYRVRFVDQNTGLLTAEKSTHTKKYDEALAIVLDWHKNGIPAARINARKLPIAKAPSKLKNEYTVLNQMLMDSTLTPEQTSALSALLSRGTKVSPPSTLHELSAAAGTVHALTSEIHFSPDFGNQELCTHLMDFWTPKKSQYVIDRRSHGHSCTERYCYDMRGITKRYYIPYFGSMLVQDITVDEFDTFFMILRNSKELAAATVNKAICCCKVAYTFAEKHHKISSSPIDEIEKFSGEQQKRGIPTDEEVEKLFQNEWPDPVAQLASKLSAFSGMRGGEIQALRGKDIGEDVIHIRHGYNPLDNLKCPKNGDERDVPVMPEICRQLILHAGEQNNCTGESFVFFSRKNGQSKPLVTNVFDEALVEAYHAIGISEEERMARNLVFHSWRHFYAKQIAERVKLEQAQMALGHRTAEMTEHYADHKTKQDYMALQTAMQDTYNHILHFPAAVNE